MGYRPGRQRFAALLRFAEPVAGRFGHTGNRQSENQHGRSIVRQRDLAALETGRRWRTEGAAQSRVAGLRAAAHVAAGGCRAGAAGCGLGAIQRCCATGQHHQHERAENQPFHMLQYNPGTEQKMQYKQQDAPGFLTNPDATGRI